MIRLLTHYIFLETPVTLLMSGGLQVPPSPSLRTLLLSTAQIPFTLYQEDGMVITYFEMMTLQSIHVLAPELTTDLADSGLLGDTGPARLSVDRPLSRQQLTEPCLHPLWELGSIQWWCSA